MTSEGGTARNTTSPFFLSFSRTLAVSALGKLALGPREAQPPSPRELSDSSFRES